MTFKNKDMVIKIKKMDIRLDQLAKISNNSCITNDVLKAVNEKLTPAEKNSFNRWLQLVESKIQNKTDRFY